MLIGIEEADKYSEGIVVIGACRVRFRKYAEAEAFVEKLKQRINAPHTLPITIHRPLAGPPFKR